MRGAFGLTVALNATDPRLLADGSPVWPTPVKFLLALALHAGTLALVISTITKPVTGERLISLVASACLAAWVIEMEYIKLQAAMGGPSHFSLSTPLHAAMFSVVLRSAVIIIGTAEIIGLIVWRDTGSQAIDVIGHAIRAGLMDGQSSPLSQRFP